MARVKVYTASKLYHAERWKRLIEEWSEVEFVARWVNWITFDEAGGDESIGRAKEGWIANVEDIRLCDVVLVYSESGDTLRGALVEVGMGIAFGKKVIVVGDNTAYGTWQHHTQVFKVPTLELVRYVLLVAAESGGLKGMAV